LFKEELAVIQCVYNDAGPHLHRTLQIQEKLGVKKSYWGDGIWSGFPLDDGVVFGGTSTDGTREIIKEYKFTKLIDCPWWGEKKTTNLMMKLAAIDGFDFVLQMSSDEYLQGDLQRFLANASEIAQDEQKPMYLMKNIKISTHPPNQHADILPRLHWQPMFNRLRYVHWWWFTLGKPTSFGSLIPGLKICHDDKPRKWEREQKMLQFQKYQEKVEREAMNHVVKQVPDPVLTRMDCGCEVGIEYYWQRGGIFGRDVRFRCPKHKLLLTV
jgi:hypothetical protein